MVLEYHGRSSSSSTTWIEAHPKCYLQLETENTQRNTLSCPCVVLVCCRSCDQDDVSQLASGCGRVRKAGLLLQCLDGRATPSRRLRPFLCGSPSGVTARLFSFSARPNPSPCSTGMSSEARRSCRTGFERRPSLRPLSRSGPPPTMAALLMVLVSPALPRCYSAAAIC
jgi:hypothetical protein